MGQPSIPPGQEARVLELLQPVGLGAERGGWTLDAVAIERTTILLEARGPAGALSTLRLHHPSLVNGRVGSADESSASFALERGGDDPAAMDPWVRAIRSNDDGEFWEQFANPAPDEAPDRARAWPPTGWSAWLLPLILLMVSTAPWLLLHRRRPPGERDAPPAEGARGSLAVRASFALGAGILGASALLVAASAPPLHSDTLRDLFLARDCLEGHGCLGASTSFGGLEQHAGWVRLLAAWQGLGLDPVGVYRAVALLSGLGASLVYFAASAVSRRWVALAATAVAFSGLVGAAGLPILWNPSLTPLAYGMLFAGLLGPPPIHRSPAVDLGAAIVSGLGAAVAMETHVVGVLTLPVLVVGLQLSAKRPRIVVPLALTVAVGLELLTSWPSLRANLGDAGRAAWMLPMLVGGLVACWGGAVLVEGRVAGHRRLALLVASLMMMTVPTLVGIAAAGHFVQLRYFAGAAVPATLLAACLARAGWRRGSVARVTVALGAVGAALGCAQSWERVSEPPAFDMREVGQIADALLEDAEPAELFFSLRGPHAPHLARALVLRASTPSVGAPFAHEDVRVARVREGQAPEGWRAVPLASGSRALLGAQRSWLRWERTEVCLRGRSAEPVCATLGPDQWRALVGDGRRFERLNSEVLPALAALRERLDDDEVALFVRVPLEASEGGERTLQLFGGSRPGSDWHVARVEGLGHRGPLGTSRVVLSGEPGARGTLTLAYADPVGDHVPWVLVPSLEVEGDELDVLRAACRHHPSCEAAPRSSGP